MIIFYFVIISLSLIGYGLLLSKILTLNVNNLGILGLLGVISIGALSYLFSPFFIHSHQFNIFFLFIGFVVLIFDFKKIIFLRKDIIYFVIILLVFFIFILVGKSHDDFSYYHFPYSIFLTEFTHPIGFGKLNEGFRSPSSLFFINAMFYLPKINYYSFNFAQAYIMLFSNIIFLKFIFKKRFIFNFLEISFFALISFIYLNIFFYRLSEHGTDRSSMILIFVCILYLLILINTTRHQLDTDQKIDLLKKFFILLVFISTIKPFYIVYLSLSIIFFLYKDTKLVLYKFFFSNTFIFCFIIFLISIFYTFFNSGCLVFPLEITCFYNFEWSLTKKSIIDINNWFELWAKAGASPNYVIEDPAYYIKNFNWLSNWFYNYFFNKVSDYLIGIIFLSLTVYLIFKNNRNKNLSSFHFMPVYFFLSIFLLEWFLKHPQLRYGGYHLIALLTFILLTCNINKLVITHKDYLRKSKIIILITFLIFITRNIDRLHKEYIVYNYNPIQSTRFIFTDVNKDFYFRYNEHMKQNMNNHNFIKFFGKKIYIIE